MPRPVIAYSYAGDIYVGDPATGETTAIVTNPTYEGWSCALEQLAARAGEQERNDVGGQHAPAKASNRGRRQRKEVSG